MRWLYNFSHRSDRTTNDKSTRLLTYQAYPQTSWGHQPQSPKKMKPWRMWQKLYGSNRCCDTLQEIQLFQTPTFHLFLYKYSERISKKYEHLKWYVSFWCEYMVGQ